MAKGVKQSVKDHVVESAKLTAVSVAEQTANIASASAYTAKSVTASAAKGSSQLIGSAADTVSRYTKGLADIGNFSQTDFSGNTASLAAGEAVRVGQSLTTAAKTTLKHSQISFAHIYYNDNRIERARAKAKQFKENPAAEYKYWNIVAGRKRNLETKGFNPKNRYIKIDQSSRWASVRARFLSKKPEKLASRKDFLIESAKNYKTVNIVDSLNSHLKNQTKKITIMILNGNDPGGLVNKVFSDSFTFAQQFSRASKELSRAGRAAGKAIKITARMIRHPIQTIKSGAAMVIQLVNTVVSAVVALLSGVISMVIAMIPMLIALVAIAAVVMVIYSVVSIFAGVFSASQSGAGAWQEIPLCDTGNSIKDYVYASQSWNPSSDQAEIWNCDQESGGVCKAGSAPPEGETAYGHLSKDPVYGFYYYEIDGIKYYTNAVASHYSSHIGDRFRVTTDTGNVFHIIVADQKAEIHTRAGNAGNSDHCVSGDGYMLEFYLDPARQSGVVNMNHDFGEDRNFAGAVTRMEKWVPQGVGDMNALGAPDFTNTDAWRGLGDGGLNPYYPGLYGQCTWGAWGKFYEIYGYDPGFRGNGRDCAYELVKTHPDKFEFSSTPKTGAIYSGIGQNHVGVILEAKPDGTLTVFDVNLDGVSNTWDAALSDWVIWEKTNESLNSYYGGVIYAVPR